MSQSNLFILMGAWCVVWGIWLAIMKDDKNGIADNWVGGALLLGGLAGLIFCYLVLNL